MTSRLLVDKLEGKTTSGTIQMPAGHVIQVLQGEVLTQITNSSSSYGSVVSQAITPKFSSSKILIQCSGCATPQASNALYFKLLRGSTEIGSGTGAAFQQLQNLEVTAIDPDEKMLQLNKFKNKIIGGAENLPFPDN